MVFFVSVVPKIQHCEVMIVHFEGLQFHEQSCSIIDVGKVPPGLFPSVSSVEIERFDVIVSREGHRNPPNNTSTSSFNHGNSGDGIGVGSGVGVTVGTGVGVGVGCLCVGVGFGENVGVGVSVGVGVAVIVGVGSGIGQSSPGQHWQYQPCQA